MRRVFQGRSAAKNCRYDVDPSTGKIILKAPALDNSWSYSPITLRSSRVSLFSESSQIILCKFGEFSTSNSFGVLRWPCLESGASRPRRARDLLFFSCKMCLPEYIRPRSKKFAIIAAFIRWSRGESQFSEGDKFTSRSHGFRLWSTRISNPSNSKQLRRWGTNISTPDLIEGSMEMMVLIMTSSIFLNRVSSSMPCCLR